MPGDKVVKGADPGEPDGAAFEAMLDAAPDPMFVLCESGEVVSANTRAERLLGYDDGGLTGVSVDQLLTGSEDDEGLGNSLRVGPGSDSNIELTAISRSGDRFPVELTLSALDNGMTLAALRDATARKRVEQQLQYMAEHDSLTGLFNRRRFEHELDREVDRAIRYGGGALAMIDIDNFKYVNDSYGHKAGDKLISTVAKLLSERLRTSDVIARLGGDEFAILLPNLDLQGAKHVADDLREMIRDREFLIDSHRVKATLSIGVAPLGEPDLTADEALARADLAMYQAKDGGRDRVAVYAQVGHEEMRAGLAWSERIRQALSEDMLVAYFQPVLDLHQNRITQWELLTRIAGEDGQLIAPASFIPTAERFGLVNEIDQWALRQAIAAITTRFDPATEGPPRIEVNLSARSFGDPELLELIQSEVTEAGIDPSCLIFEVTETAAVANIDAAVGFADALAELGCGFALDDFGTGFGSFYYLKHLPLTYIKIDGAFIQNLTRSAVDQLVVKAVIEVAQGFGLQTIAEYVGDEGTLRLLRHWGVNYGQGYYVGRPAPTLVGTPGLG